MAKRRLVRQEFQPNDSFPVSVTRVGLADTALITEVADTLYRADRPGRIARPKSARMRLVGGRILESYQEDIVRDLKAGKTLWAIGYDHGLEEVPPVITGAVQTSPHKAVVYGNFRQPNCRLDFARILPTQNKMGELLCAGLMTAVHEYGANRRIITERIKQPNRPGDPSAVPILHPIEQMFQAADEWAVLDYEHLTVKGLETALLQRYEWLAAPQSTYQAL
ncbi:MAG TPA: hypothetical protein VG992_00435 [Candidatus Saccharimonadales bacterium]|nr:hypothetical protein [Candidatus Saccharimonadales bacterium]